LPPSIRPEVGELAVRGGIVGTLVVLLPPLAILPTIEFGQDESRECATRISSVGRSERAKATPAPAAPVPARRRGRRQKLPAFILRSGENGSGDG